MSIKLSPLKREEIAELADEFQKYYTDDYNVIFQHYSGQKLASSDEFIRIGWRIAQLISQKYPGISTVQAVSFSSRVSIRISEMGVQSVQSSINEGAK